MTALEQRVLELEREHSAFEAEDSDSSSKTGSPETAIDSTE